MGTFKRKRGGIATRARRERAARKLKQASLSPAEAELRRRRKKEQGAARYAAETPAQRERRLQRVRAYQASLKIANKRQRERERLLKEQTQLQRIFGGAETPEDSETRRIFIAEMHPARRHSARRQNWHDFNNSRIENNSSVNKPTTLIVVGSVNKNCKVCSVLNMEGKAEKMCCCNAKFCINF